MGNVAGVAAAMPMDPDYLLFTDADIHHDSDNLAALVAGAEAQRRDMVSCMVRLPTDGLAEKALIPAFVFFFLNCIRRLDCIRWAPHRGPPVAACWCVPAPWSAAAAAGHSCTIIDDCALARAIKRAGGSIWLGLTLRARSTRSYGSFADIGRMISRSAFNQLRHSYLLLGITMTVCC